MRTHYKVAALLIVALVFSAAECAASCAFTSCNPSRTATQVPPCHRHSQPASQQNPAPCGHQHQIFDSDAASISQGPVSSLLVTPPPAPAVFESQPDL